MLEMPSDIQAQIEAKIATGRYPDEATVLREALASLEEYDEDIFDSRERFLLNSAFAPLETPFTP